MSWSDCRGWLICYDIPCPRRLHRVHRYLRANGIWIQYSAFAAMLSERQVRSIMQGLGKRIDPAEDDVRIYPLPAYCEAVLIGARILPLGVALPDQQLIRILGRQHF